MDTCLNKTKITTDVIPGLEDTKVCNLFKEEERDWDHDLVRDIFNEEDAAKILNIPLSYTSTADTWLWLADEKRGYTVKSGYRLLCQLGSDFSGMVTDFNWLKLWSLAIPPKIKNFIWRVLQNCLPTLENLRRKHVEVYPICPVCNSDIESLEHILFTCAFAQRCW